MIYMGDIITPEDCIRCAQICPNVTNFIYKGEAGQKLMGYTYLEHLKKLKKAIFFGHPMHAIGLPLCANLRELDIRGAIIHTGHLGLPLYCDYFEDWFEQRYNQKIQHEYLFETNKVLKLLDIRNCALTTGDVIPYSVINKMQALNPNLTVLYDDSYYPSELDREILPGNKLERRLIKCAKWHYNVPF